MELFSDFFAHPDEKLHTKLKKYFQAKRSSFSLAVYLSLILHSAIFVIFCFSALRSPSVSASNRSNQRAIFQAIKEEPNLSNKQENGMTDLLKGFDISGYNLSEDEKKQLYKKLIASYTLIEDSGMEDEAPREITKYRIIS